MKSKARPSCARMDTRHCSFLRMVPFRVDWICKTALPFTFHCGVCSTETDLSGPIHRSAESDVHPIRYASIRLP
jgi:hypothetical protein